MARFQEDLSHDLKKSNRMIKVLGVDWKAVGKVTILTAWDEWDLVQFSP